MCGGLSPGNGRVGKSSKSIAGATVPGCFPIHCVFRPFFPDLLPSVKQTWRTIPPAQFISHALSLSSRAVTMPALVAPPFGVVRQHQTKAGECVLPYSCLQIAAKKKVILTCTMLTIDRQISGIRLSKWAETGRRWGNDRRSRLLMPGHHFCRERRALWFIAGTDC